MSVKYRKQVLGGLVAALLVAGTPAGTLQATDVDLAVIVNPAVQASICTQEGLRSLFVRSEPLWPSGERVVPFQFMESHPVRIAFDQAIFGRDPGGVEEMWMARRLSGERRAPRQLPNHRVVGRFVAGVAGAIAYLPVENIPEGVRVMATVRGGQVACP